MINNIDIFLEYEELIQELLKIDNEAENDDLSIDKLKDYFNNSFNKLNINTSSDSIIITEGNPFLTIDIIKNLCFTNNRYILFINRSYVGINKWLCKYLAPYLGVSIECDYSINYNKYIGTNKLVIPVGEKALIEQVKEDFGN